MRAECLIQAVRGKVQFISFVQGRFERL